MRILILLCAVWSGLLGFASEASAQDSDRPTLRGSNVHELGRPRAYQWTGLYGGGQYGYAIGNVNISAGTADLVGYILRNTAIEGTVTSWTSLANGSTTGSSWGAFVGYNWQFDQALLGAEINYNRTELSYGASDAMARFFQNDAQAPAGHHFFYDASVASSASVTITDVATFRATAGWAAGRFMPYMFGGIAVGRADIIRSATVRVNQTDIPDDPIANPPLADVNLGPTTREDAARGVFMYGVTAGLGVNYAITDNVFLRGEWEFVQFAPVNSVTIAINQLRVGVAFKF